MAAPKSFVLTRAAIMNVNSPPGGGVVRTGYFPRFPEICPLVLMRLPLFARGCRITLGPLH